MPTTTDRLVGTNLSIVVGVLSRAPELRTLPSGDQLIALEVTVRPEAAPAESVPIVWPGTHGAALAWTTGDEVLVVGRVRRRFFRAGGATQSRTEVVAASAVLTRRAAGVRKALSAAILGVQRAIEG